MSKINKSELRTKKKLITLGPGPELRKHFSSSTQLSMNFNLIINAEIAQINRNFRFSNLSC